MGDHPIKREFDEAYSLVDLKATDYAEETNYFSNFEFAAKAAGITVDQVFLVMMGIKLARLAQLIGAGKVPNFESIDDNLLDSINYPGLLKAYRRQARVDEFMDEEERFGGVLESEYNGLLDAVLNDPINSMFDDPFSPCTDEDCCGLEPEEDDDIGSCYDGGCDCEDEDFDFMDAQVEDALELVNGWNRDQWQVGDAFRLTDTNIYFGYGIDKEIMGSIPDVEYTVQVVKDKGIKFMSGDRSYYATWNEIRKP